MIKQIRTFNNLLMSTKYVNTNEEVFSHLNFVVSKTLEHLKTEDCKDNPEQKQKKTLILGEKTPESLVGSIEIVLIDEMVLPMWKKIFGEEKEPNTAEFYQKQCTEKVRSYYR